MTKSFRLCLLAGACALTVAGLAVSPAPAAAAAAASAQAVRWTGFTDPSERAFTIDVPAGWSVTGGSRRVSALEVRTGVTVRSPDNAIEVFVGDLDIPVFTLPNQMLSMAGFGEGSTYSPGYGQSFFVNRYLPGDAFAQTWGMRRVGYACPGAKVTSVRGLPQATRAMDNLFARYGINSQIRAGEAEFACQVQGGSGVGYTFAATELVESGGNGVWGAKVIAGFTARADRKAEAAAVLSHMVASFRLDPQWAARQQGTQANVSRIVSDTNSVVSNSINERFANQQSGQERAWEQDTQARRGLATYTDPASGRQVELDSSERHWRTADGRYVTKPEPGAVEMTRASH